MSSNRWQELHILCNRYHNGPADELTQYLPDEEKQAFDEVEITAPSLTFVDPEKLFENLHSSWLLAPVQTVEEPIRSLVVHALGETHRKGLLHLVQTPPAKKSLAPAVKRYILQKFYTEFASNLQPIDRPDQPGKLAVLLDWPREKTLELTRILGLWDLSEELRRIIEKERLTTVFQCLSPREQIFLQRCLKSRDRLSMPPVGLEKWGGDKMELRVVVNKRGLSRLAKALSGHPVETIKILCRTLDTGQAKTLISYIQRKEIKGVTPVAITQVEQAMKFLEQQESN